LVIESADATLPEQQADTKPIASTLSGITIRLPRWTDDNYFFFLAGAAFFAAALAGAAAFLAAGFAVVLAFMVLHPSSADAPFDGAPRSESLSKHVQCAEIHFPPQMEISGDHYRNLRYITKNTRFLWTNSSTATPQSIAPAPPEVRRHHPSPPLSGSVQTWTSTSPAPF
jgi:hypothetical protein